jgi:hypothetical protein
MNVKLDDLEMAVDFVSAGALLDAQAFIDRSSGAVIYTGEGVDEADIAEFDLDDEARFVPVPSKQELDLGRELVLEFVAQSMPSELDAVRDLFRHKGAYARYKALLERVGQLDAWYAFEAQAIRATLRRWCEENDIPVE